MRANTSCVICERVPDADSVCISYIPGQISLVHNANTLGASLLARVFGATRNSNYGDLARKAFRYTAKYQREDGSWYYGEKQNLHWVDNFHTAYVLDCFKHYERSTGDNEFSARPARGYDTGVARSSSKMEHRDTILRRLFRSTFSAVRRQSIPLFSFRTWTPTL